MALHAKTWKLARHGRIRTRSSDHPVPEPPHSRQADPRERSRSLGAPSKQAPRQSRLAIHNRKRSRQTQKAIPSIRVTRATRGPSGDNRIASGADGKGGRFPAGAELGTAFG